MSNNVMAKNIYSYSGVNSKSKRSSISIDTGADSLPIEIKVVSKLPPGAGKVIVESALKQQREHPEFIDEFNEPSAIIAKTNFAKGDPTAVYTFGVDTREHVFHRHEGHRIITAITGAGGCLLKFSVCTAEQATWMPEKFLDNLHIIRIPADRLFVLRFSGTVYHQFCPDNGYDCGFFAVSVHTNEAENLSGDLLQTVLSNEGNIPLLTEPAPRRTLQLLRETKKMTEPVEILLDI
ncbi:MAG: hypothetical protein K2W82_12250 [Candidatus Obscuribacterales bacterium]|nr:hypothetical protein [Candidatus Obscuribacterales bacterium]